MPDQVPGAPGGARPDWVLAQRDWLRPTVVGRLGIHPPWCGPVGEVPVSIDPGPTFGHGAHPTTALVLAEVDRTAGPGRSVLDVGCGSGVLAIAAARLGAGPVVAVDVEEDAVAWTRHNAEANGSTVDASSTPVADVDGTFDLVLANVLPVVHEEISGPVAARVAAPTPGGGGGLLVVSGVPDEHTDRVVGLYVDRGLAEVSRTTDDGWTAVVLSR